MTFKTVPFILLSLAVFTPSGFAAPAPAPQAAVNPDQDADTNPSPTSPPSDTENSPPTVSMFFTPAVFHSDYYYWRPAPTENNAAAIMPAETAFPEPTTFYDDLAPQESPSAIVDATPTSDDAEAIFPTPPPEDMSDDDLIGTDLGLTATSASLATGPLSTSFSESVPTSTYSSHTSEPTLPIVPLPTQGHAAASRATEQSRKAAVIGTILAVGCLSGLIACAFCMRCRLPPSLRPKRTSVEEGDANTRDQYKGLPTNEKNKSSSSNHLTTPDIVVVPVLNSGSPSSSNSLSPVPKEPPAETWKNQPQPQPQQYQLSGAEADGQFDDVTHILSEDTFQADVESEHGSGSENRTSGAASVTAESFATCESRYSEGSSGRARRAADEDHASFLSMSPPESPVLQTPKQAQFCVVTRPRSKTFAQSASPLLGKHLSSSRSLPTRYVVAHGGEGVEVMSAFDEDESEWDIAAAYGARFSKNSLLQQPGGLGQVLKPIPERVESVEIGGKRCVMVQG